MRDTHRDPQAGYGPGNTDDAASFATLVILQTHTNEHFKTSDCNKQYTDSSGYELHTSK